MSWQSCPDPALGNMDGTGAIETVIVPRTRDLGGFEVRRALPSRTRKMVGPFIFFDQMGSAEFGVGQGIDVRPVNRSQLELASNLEGFDFSEFGFEVTGGAFQFLMPEQELDGFEIASLFEDQCHFGAPDGMCAIKTRIKTDPGDPIIDNARILA